MKSSGPVPVALIYPNSYAVGMSNLGYQTVFRLFSEQPAFQCERAFIYDSPFTFTPKTLETQKSLSSFPVLAFSSSFELDYGNILLLLKSSGIPLLTEHRGSGAPFVIFGGVTAFYNPSMLAPFADAIFIGEAEELIGEFAGIWRSGSSHTDKEEILRQLADVEGVYVPAVHGFSPPDGSLRKRNVDIGAILPSTSNWLTDKAHMNMFLVEIGRGCGRGCRFCAAGHVYFPVRFWPADVVLGEVERYVLPDDKIGLVGAALSDYRGLGSLCRMLVGKGHQLGFSSLRADRIDEDLLQSAVAGGIATISLAPEAGSERMRKIIHKQMTRDHILSAVGKIATTSVENLKLYFMIGLPFEKYEDIEAIIDLTRDISAIFRRSGKRHVRVSINAFIPKPHTPFQWCGMASASEIKNKRRMLNRELGKIPGVYIVRKSVREEIIQGILSNGGIDTAMQLAREFEKGSGIGGFVSRYNYRWLFSEKSFDYRFPWDFVNTGNTKKGLWRSYLAAKSDAR